MWHHCLWSYSHRPATRARWCRLTCHCGARLQSLDLDHLSRVRKDRAALAEIQVKHEAAAEKADEKISLATQLYEMVDAHIRQLGA